MTRSIAVPRGVFERLVRHLSEELQEIEKQLVAVEENIEMFEERYGVSSEAFEAMLRGKDKWRLPEEADLDVVEWEALLTQRRLLKEKLERTRKLWKSLVGRLQS